VSLCQYLLSHTLPECGQLGGLIRGELEISAPRMTRHAKATESHKAAIEAEFQKLVQAAKSGSSALSDASQTDRAAIPSLCVTLPEGVDEKDLANDLKYHTNRYAPVGTSLQRTSVRFGWSQIAFGEIRDLNRHRTGTNIAANSNGILLCR